MVSLVPEIRHCPRSIKTVGPAIGLEEHACTTASSDDGKFLGKKRAPVPMINPHIPGKFVTGKFSKLQGILSGSLC